MTLEPGGFRATALWVDAQLGRLAAPMQAAAAVGSVLRVQACMHECFSELHKARKGRGKAVASSGREGHGKDAAGAGLRRSAA